jgi:hypothetical protein
MFKKVFDVLSESYIKRTSYKDLTVNKKLEFKRHYKPLNME